MCFPASEPQHFLLYARNVLPSFSYGWILCSFRSTLDSMEASPLFHYFLSETLIENSLFVVQLFTVWLFYEKVKSQEVGTSLSHLLLFPH